MKSTSSYHNPFHLVTTPAENEAGAANFRYSLDQEVNDVVALELTAEQMIKDEAALLGAYVADDADQAKEFWHDLKDELTLWEMSAGRLLLSVADQPVPNGTAKAGGEMRASLTCTNSQAVDG